MIETRSSADDKALKNGKIYLEYGSCAQSKTIQLVTVSTLKRAAFPTFAGKWRTIVEFL